MEAHGKREKFYILFSLHSLLPSIQEIKVRDSFVGRGLRETPVECDCDPGGVPVSC